MRRLVLIAVLAVPIVAVAGCARAETSPGAMRLGSPTLTDAPRPGMMYRDTGRYLQHIP